MLITLQINAEFKRLTTSQLVPLFFENVDRYTERLLAILRNKGGAQGAKIQEAIKILEHAPVMGPFHIGQDQKDRQLSQCSFCDLSVICNFFHDSQVIFQWILWSPKNFEMDLAVFYKCSLSVISQWRLEGLTCLSIIFWQSRIFTLLEITERLRDHWKTSFSKILIDLSKITRRMSDDLSVISQ